MGKVIEITIRDKIAKNFRDKEAEYICGNSDFTVVFDFDEEWDAFEAKTARFKYNGTHQDVVFTGNSCKVPIIENTFKIEVGVFAGNLNTTTSATIMAKKSILCGSGVPAAPSDDVYNQIMELLSNIDGVDPEAVADAVKDYMEKNPVTETDPTVPAWAKAETKPTYTAEEVGALPKDTVIPSIEGLATTDYVDDKFDQLSGGNVAYDEAQELTEEQKAQARENIGAQPVGDYLESTELTEAVNTALAQAKASGEFDGADGKDGTDGQDGADGVSATHEWNGTVLTITSASGTSSADLKGEQGEPGADYVLTDADKTEIAEMASELVEVPESGGTATMQPLTLTGAVSATYDGSEAVTVEIPESSGGGNMRLLVEHLFEEDTSFTNVTYDADSEGEPLACKQMRINIKNYSNTASYTYIRVNGIDVATVNNKGGTLSIIIDVIDKYYVNCQIYCDNSLHKVTLANISNGIDTINSVTFFGYYGNITAGGSVLMFGV